MSEVDAKRKFSNSMYVLKFWAIVSVICAHSGVAACSNPIIARCLYNFSAVGVCIFFLLSGYFFHVKDSFSAFAKKKEIGIGAPWLVAATLTYCIRFVGKGFYVDVFEYINYLFGNGSLYYYLTVLMLFYFTYYFLYKYKTVLYGSIVLSIVSIFLTAFEVISLYPYLNPFNWCGFFATGILLQNVSLEKVSKGQHAIIVSVCGVVWLTLTLLGMNTGYYWFPLSLVNEVLLIGALFSVSCLIGGVVGKGLAEVGKLTFPIYLYHLPLVWQLPQGNSVWIVFTRIFVTLGICFTVFFLLKLLSKKFFKKPIEILLGIK